MCDAARVCHIERGALYLLSTCHGNLATTNLLDEPLKDFIVNPADLPWKCVKRLATSGERVNHGSWGKCTTSVECKTSISAVLTVTSGLGPLWNKRSLRSICLCYSLFMLTLIMCFTLGLKQLVVTLMLKL